ncbi:exodeoxyribonuclease VII large subunit [Methylocapsa sp. S129]|uniref:exodeoxyribonuclease VII large subunit n=1 Tax=Methylocapsa sp. S129 TaxID=1641869 RepID=UPI00131B4F07|nr:exodeoxyribonuclease VII large subunit [Methylocapsa sp. S129]
MAESSPTTNAPELSVTELSSALKRTIEDRFGYVRVRGEVSNYRGPHSSGHAYFSLKDQGARIDAVVWKGVFARLRVRPEEGMEVIATGKITTFPGKSAYQIVIEAMEPAGIGALMALLEARRVKLAAEGLFDAGRKQLLPYLPSVIGVVTSPTGAVIRDILHRLADRFPVHVLVWPVRVQGETSAAEVANAIAGFNALEPDGAIPRPDVLIIARGGGSLEDLWSFNEEIVARAAAESLIPLVSAIGHETDWTLIDHIADVRAPTPTAAAELSVPVRAELLANLADLDARRRGAILRVAERARASLRASARALPSGEAILAVPRQRLDRASAALAASARAGFDRRAIALERLSRRLVARSPQALLASAVARQKGAARSFARAVALDRERRREQLARVAARLTAALAARSRFDVQQLARTAQAQIRLRRALQGAITQRRARLAAAAQFLNAVSYRNVLKRGFALVRDGEGTPLRNAAAIGAGQPIRIEFADGEVTATAHGRARPDSINPLTKSPTASRPAKAAKREPSGGQGSLF